MGRGGADYEGLRCIRVAREGPLLELCLEHPESELNAVDELLHGELTRLFRELRRESEARAVLLTARGRAFSAGGHFDWFAKLRDLEQLERLRRDAKQMIWDLLDVEIPIVAALNGPAVGLGASLALLCDAVFMSEEASISDPHVRVGLVAGDGGAVIWPLLLGPMRAKQFLLTGDAIGAAEAERLGLVTRAVPAAELEREARGFALRLAEGAPLALRYTKLAVNKWVKDLANLAFDASTALELVTFQSEDHAEALAALRERRAPRFRGR